MFDKSSVVNGPGSVNSLLFTQEGERKAHSSGQVRMQHANRLTTITNHIKQEKKEWKQGNGNDLESVLSIIQRLIQYMNLHHLPACYTLVCTIDIIVRSGSGHAVELFCLESCRLS